MAAAGGLAEGSAAVGVTARDFAHIRHPRSDSLMSVLPDPERHYRLTAQVADTIFTLEDPGCGLGAPDLQGASLKELIESAVCAADSDELKGNTPTANSKERGDGEEELVRSASRRAALCALAKVHIELDRNEWARENGYAVGLFRMVNAGLMAKGDLIIGVPSECRGGKMMPDLTHPENEVPVGCRCSG